PASYTLSLHDALPICSSFAALPPRLLDLFVTDHRPSLVVHLASVCRVGDQSRHDLSRLVTDFQLLQAAEQLHLGVLVDGPLDHRSEEHTSELQSLAYL